MGAIEGLEIGVKEIGICRCKREFIKGCPNIGEKHMIFEIGQPYYYKLIDQKIMVNTVMRRRRYYKVYVDLDFTIGFPEFISPERFPGIFEKI